MIRDKTFQLENKYFQTSNTNKLKIKKHRTNKFKNFNTHVLFKLVRNFYFN